MNNKEIKIPFFGLLYIAVFLFAVMNISGFLNSHMLVHIKIGEWIIDNGRVMKNDIFSYGGTGEWINYYWFTDVIYAFLYRTFGIGSILIMHSAMIAGAFSLIMLFLYKKGINTIVLAVFLIFGLYAGLPQWGAWPYSFNFLFLPLFIYVFDCYYEKGGKKYIIFLMLLQLLWVNMNSEFFYPFIIIMMYAFSDIISFLKKESEINIGIKRIGIVFIALLPLLIVNPYGIKEAINVLSGYIFMIKDRRNDWAAPNFHGFAKYSNILLAVSIMLVYIFKKRDIIKERKYLFIYVFVVFSFLYAQRHIMIFAIITMMFLPLFLEYDKEIKSKIIFRLYEKSTVISNKIYKMASGKIINIILILSVTIMFFFNIKGSEANFNEIIANWARSSGVKYLKDNNIEGKGFHSDGQGDMIIWYNSPKTKVFVDSRDGVYSGKHQNMYAKIMLLKDNWEKIVKDEKINWILLQKNQTASVLRIMDDKWIIVYESRVAVMFLKKDYYNKIKDRIKIKIE